MLPSVAFWKNKKVLVTGHTGFKGSWLSLLLTEMGANVSGVSLAPVGSTNLYFELNMEDKLASDHRIDLRDFEGLSREIDEVSPDIVFHLAAQSLVRRGYLSPIDTIGTNVLGTAHLLESVRQAGLKPTIVSVTSDKVYANNQGKKVFSEFDPLGGYDPYSVSKAAADLVSQMYSAAYLMELKVPVGIARAGNVIGGGDWSENRLFPDLVRAWSSDVPASLRFPQATRPWQHVLEPIHGYLTLAERLYANPGMAGNFNFGPDPKDCLTVQHAVEIASRFWPANPGWTIETEDHFHESADLAIDSSKARDLLGVSPVWNSEQAIERTIHWYRDFCAGAPAEALCREDIDAFEDMR